MINKIKWHYKSDQIHVENAEFMAWFSTLKKITWLETAYGGPLEETTGIECWFDYFKSSYSPEAAAESDRSYWE